MPASTYWNPRRGPLPPAAERPSPRAFHRRLPGYEVTPLVDAATIADRLGLGHVWVKDESWRLGLPAFKVLGASWATYNVLIERLGHEPEWSTLDELAAALEPLRPLTLVTATDGNHGRAVSRTARLFGLQARVLMPAGTAQARVDAIAAEGADVTVIHGDYDEAVAQASALAGARAVVVSDTSWPGYETVPAWVAEGYRTMFEEVSEQLAAAGAEAPDVVLVQTGVGALAVAALRHFRDDAGNGPLVAIVEPTSADCVAQSARAGHPVTVPGPHPSIMAGLNCGSVSAIAWPVLSAGADAFVTVTDDQAEQAMRDLAPIGVISGETGASGLAGLGQLVADAPGRLGPNTSVLVLNTEGATDPDNYARVVGAGR